MREEQECHVNGGEAVDDTRGGGDTRDDGVATREVAGTRGMAM